MSILFFIGAILFGAAIAQGLECLYQQFDFDGYTGPKLLFFTALMWIAFLFSGCIHTPVITPSGPGGAVQSVDATGVTFTAQGHDLWLNEHVPANLFTQTPTGWHMTNLAYHEGNQIRLKEINP